MTELTTEAGKRLLAEIDALPAVRMRPEPYPETVGTIVSRGAAYDRIRDALPVIEAEARESDPVCAEAVAAERVRIAEAVKARACVCKDHGSCTADCPLEYNIEVDVVLAIVEADHAP